MVPWQKLKVDVKPKRDYYGVYVLRRVCFAPPLITPSSPIGLAVSLICTAATRRGTCNMIYYYPGRLIVKEQGVSEKM